MTPTDLVGSYDYRLVALSAGIAVLSSYTALDLAARVTAARGIARFYWLAGGSAAMGIGIWSMHFTAMGAGAPRRPQPASDLIIIDLSLPDWDWLDVIRQIRSEFLPRMGG